MEFTDAELEILMVAVGEYLAKKECAFVGYEKLAPIKSVFYRLMATQLMKSVGLAQSN